MRPRNIPKGNRISGLAICNGAPDIESLTEILNSEIDLALLLSNQTDMLYLIGNSALPCDRIGVLRGKGPLDLE